MGVVLYVECLYTTYMPESPYYRKMDLPTQTLYGEFLDRLRTRELRRSIGHTPGSIVTKTLQGRTYCYFQTLNPGGPLHQVYLGKKSTEMDQLLSQFTQGQEEADTENLSLSRLAAQLRAGDSLITDHATSRLLATLADLGLFRAGGVLVGTQAMSVLGNLLGARWTSEALRTQDVDVALPPLHIVAPNHPEDVPSALDRLKMGFLPVPALDPRHPSSSFKIRGQSLRLDILTPRRSEKETLVFLPQWNTAAQALPYLDYLLEDPAQGGIVNGEGILVSVPHPARFAFHKLVVQGERHVTEALRSAKDLRQSAQLISLLLEERPGDLESAWQDFIKRGRGWTSRLRRGLTVLSRQAPGLAEKLFSQFPEMNPAR